MLPQNRPGDADVGTADDHPVDMAADAPVGGDEAELLAVAAMGAQVEAGGAQPADRQGLELVAGIEDAERAAVEALAGIHRRTGELVDQFAGTRLTPAQVVLCMIDLKLTRLARDPKHQDSMLDIAGYAAVLHEVTK